MSLSLRALLLTGPGICLVIALATGCSFSEKPREDDTTLDLRHIASAYETIKRGYNRAPRDTEELKKVLGEFHDAGLNGKPEEVLISSRDGHPYVIVLNVHPESPSTNEIFIYEKTGKDGVRYAMTLSREVLKISDVEFATAPFAAGHRPEGK